MSNYRYKKDNYLYSLFPMFETEGPFQMPKIKPVTDVKISNLLTFNFANTCNNPDKFHICFYVDDYQFERAWNLPQKTLQTLKNFKGIISPDFSLFRDFPTVLQIYNCWRNRVLAAYYQLEGLKVIPNVSWSDEASFAWCFDGLPQNSVLAISSNGCLKNKTSRELFVKGYTEMKKRLSPIKVIIVGGLPPDLQNDPIIEQVPGYTSLFGKAEKNLIPGGDSYGR